jgi:nucleoside-diphosphate-sugar epimerase
MKILITGANGYIGKSLHNTLKDKYEVTAITRKEVNLTNSSDVNLFFLGEKYDVVIHCAVVGGSRLVEDKWNVMDINLTMYYNLLANKDHFKKFIHFGSGAETYMPKEPYGYSKKVIAKSILNQPNFYNLKIFGAFNENELNTRFIKANIKRYINKEPMQVYQDKAMDFFYILDLVSVIEYYINEEKPLKEFDCVYKDPLNLVHITKIINELDNHKVETQINNIELGIPYISNYRNSLPINFIGLEEGIKQVYNKLK